MVTSQFVVVLMLQHFAGPEYLMRSHWLGKQKTTSLRDKASTKKKTPKCLFQPAKFMFLSLHKNPLGSFSLSIHFVSHNNLDLLNKRKLLYHFCQNI